MNASWQTAKHAAATLHTAEAPLLISCQTTQQSAQRQRDLRRKKKKKKKAFTTLTGANFAPTTSLFKHHTISSITEAAAVAKVQVFRITGLRLSTHTATALTAV
jgi:hypothetical protein